MTYRKKQGASLSDQLKTVLHSRDGEDHVNVDRNGKTRIGQVAAPDKLSKFFIPYLGDFRSTRAFAYWMVSNNDLHRVTPPNGPIRELSNAEYHDLLIFAKYFQLCSFRNTIEADKDLLDKPWTSYHLLPGSMLKQYSMWKSYPDIAKSMCQYILMADLSKSPCENFSPAIMDTVNRLLQAKAEELQTTFIPYENMEAEAKKSSKGENRRQRNQSPQEGREFDNSKMVPRHQDTELPSSMTDATEEEEDMKEMSELLAPVLDQELVPVTTDTQDSQEDPAADTTSESAAN